MPLMNRFELLAHLSEHVSELKMPVYILSTSDAESDKSKAECFSVSGNLVKPLSIDCS